MQWGMVKYPGIIYRCCVKKSDYSFNKRHDKGDVFFKQGRTLAEELECCLDGQGEIWYKVKDYSLQQIREHRSQMKETESFTGYSP